MSGYAKLNIGTRHTLRGLKRCPACGKYNGNRSQVCRNLECPLRRQILNAKKSMDSIQLISYTDAKLYSVRVKDRECSPRNFVQITDTTLITEVDSLIVSRNAICYVDTCKYDSNDVDISCKHVKSASESIKLAEVFPIQYDALWSLRIDAEQKVRLWEMYQSEEMNVPAVQRINKTTFVTKCTRSHVFPSGRLHVTVLNNESSNKSETYSCACKKLKILLSPNNSVVLKEDICDHLLLVLAAVLSKSPVNSEFSNFTKEMKTFWMLDDNNIKYGVSSDTQNGDIFIFDNELLPSDDLSDFTDNMLKSVLRDENANSNTHHNMYQGDPSMVSGCTVDDADIPFEGIGCGIDAMNDECTRLELCDGEIELMDQFQLTDQIDLCSDEVILSDSDLFQGNSIVMPDLSDTIIDDLIVAQNQTHSQLLLPVTPAQVVENNNLTIATKKPKKVIISQAAAGGVVATPTTIDTSKPADPGPSLEYVMWLDHIIECINMSIDFNIKDPNVALSFNVHEDIFAHFSKSFTNGIKCRLPNSTVLIKKGRFKGLLKYTWILRTAAKVQRIFSTKNMSVEVERQFQPNGDSYVPYVEDQHDLIVLSKKYKKISPKMCIAHIWFDCSSDNHRTGFKMEWIPNVFPKSGFGILNIEFSIGLKK